MQKISTIKNRIRFSKKQKYFLADKMQEHHLEQTRMQNSNIFGLQGRYSEKNKIVQKKLPVYLNIMKAESTPVY